MTTARTRWLGAAIAIAGLASLAFIAAYQTRSLLWEGLTLTIAILAFALTAIGWSNWLLPHDQVEDERDEYPSSFAQRADQREQVERVEAQLSRSGVLGRLLVGALGLFGLATLLPLRSLGTAPRRTSERSKWRAGVRAVREDGSAIHVADVNVDAAVTVFPEGALDDPHSPAMLIRLPADTTGARGYIAYSKICTHAGCPVALYRAQARQLMCPCHQSIFSVTNDGAVLSGPADHALPQLPLEIGDDGYVRAAGDFSGPIGPGTWDPTS
jgi:ubiquinol-cytochrome c reductase iron-sulfur subunit